MIDTSLLKSLFEDDQMIIRYLSTFRIDVPITLSEINLGIKNEDWEHVSILAHSLKSQLQYLKEDSASAIAYQLEKICDNGVTPDSYEVMRLLSELMYRLSKIFNNIDKFLAI